METTIQKIETGLLFPNLFAAIKAEKLEELNKFISGLDAENDVWQILDKWYYGELLTPSKKRVIWIVEDLKKYLIERKTKLVNASIDDKLKHLLTVGKAGDLKSIKISVEWKKNRTWGANPTCEAWTNIDYYKSGSIGGCGYDKLSTAIAEALNQSNEFLKQMYLLKEKNAGKKNGEVFGYGSGYGILPRLEGGVGVSCYPEIFKAIGFNWSNMAWGKTYDVYHVSPIA